MDGQLLAGRYQLLHPLGAGGMGKTFVAKDIQRPGQPRCVVKQLQPPSHEAEVLAISKRLFNQEAEALEKLGHHDQIPQLLAYFEQDQEFYLVEEFIDGHPLSEELQPGHIWSTAKVLRCLHELLEILEFVHSHRVIHRDLKPDNIIRRARDGKLVLIDFGAVKQVRAHPGTATQMVSRTVAIGTPGYIPTEQQWGQPRLNSDLYALGKIGIQALTGVFPSQLSEDDNGNVIWQPQKSVPPGLITVLDKMVRQYYKHRYATAADVSQALRNLATQTPNTKAMANDLVAGLSRTSKTDETLDRVDRLVQLRQQHHQRPATVRGSAPSKSPPTSISTAPRATSSSAWFPILLGGSVVLGVGITAAVAWQSHQETLVPAQQVIQAPAQPVIQPVVPTTASPVPPTPSSPSPRLSTPSSPTLPASPASASPSSPLLPRPPLRQVRRHRSPRHSGAPPRHRPGHPLGSQRFQGRDY